MCLSACSCSCSCSSRLSLTLLSDRRVSFAHLLSVKGAPAHLLSLAEKRGCCHAPSADRRNNLVFAISPFIGLNIFRAQSPTDPKLASWVSGCARWAPSSSSQTTWGATRNRAQRELGHCVLASPVDCVTAFTSIHRQRGRKYSRYILTDTCLKKNTLHW